MMHINASCYGILDEGNPYFGGSCNQAQALLIPSQFSG